jgi:hypothetical protein
MFDRLFLAHPRSVGESYGEHMRVAGRVGLLLIGGGIAALIHAVFPRFHQTTGSALIRRLAAELDGRAPPAAPDMPANP